MYTCICCHCSSACRFSPAWTAAYGRTCAAPHSTGRGACRRIGMEAATNTPTKRQKYNRKGKIIDGIKQSSLLCCVRAIYCFKSSQRDLACRIIPWSPHHVKLSFKVAASGQQTTPHLKVVADYFSLVHMGYSSIITLEQIGSVRVSHSKRKMAATTRSVVSCPAPVLAGETLNKSPEASDHLDFILSGSYMC